MTYELNRIGDQFISNCEDGTHQNTNGNFSAWRVPCSWENVVTDRADHFAWSELDKKLEELRHLEISPIAGFLHHGSGPRFTSLIDPDFPDKFTDYAREFSRRYPWIERYTPIDEICITAQKSCLQGYWYPHLQNDLYFYKALIHQCKGTILAMREIRRINLKAIHIQTESIEDAQAESTLALDLLCGLINQDHKFYKIMLSTGIRAVELDWFIENACPPNMIEIKTLNRNALQSIWQRYKIPMVQI